MELVPEAGITSLRPAVAPAPPEEPTGIVPEAPPEIVPPVVEEAPQEPPQTALPVAEEAPVAEPEAPIAGPAAPAAVETPTEELARQVLPDESQDYEAMIKELEVQMEGKPAPKLEAPTEEPITTVPCAPVGGPAARVKITEPEAPTLPEEAFQVNLSDDIRAGIQSGVASIDPDLRDFYALQLERKLDKNGT
jgi:hypothetical protein